MMKWPRRIVEDRRFRRTIIGLILVNAAVLGLLTLRGLSAEIRETLQVIDRFCLTVFCAEIALKLMAYRGRFFRDGWNVFDAVVIGIALVPAAGELSVLRALRVLRVLRLATAVPSMRRVINGMFMALPGGASVAGVLALLFYIGAIIGFGLFGETVPQHFGDIGTTFFTLFKLMTLEGWPDIADEVLVHHPEAWVYFVIFIIFTTFTTLNLLFGIIVSAMEKAKEEEVREDMAAKGIDVPASSSEMRLAVIEEDLKRVLATLTALQQSPEALPNSDPSPAGPASAAARGSS